MEVTTHRKGRLMRSYEECFAKNLQHLRRERGLSQRALGHLIGFSDKAVSKWERGGGIPDISVLYALCEVFSVRLDDLFTEGSVYFLGIDGGGTKTLMVLTDENGNILREEKSEGCNPIDIGLEAAKSRLRAAIGSICRGIPLGKISVFAGIAGGTSADNKPALTAFFRELGFLCYESDSDNRSIIAAGLGRKNGVSLILGTGICAFRQKDGVRERFSGWGYLFDNGGSGYNIGRDGITAHFEALHGLAPKTLISDLLEKEERDPQALLGALYGGGKRKIASYARVVYEAAGKGDAVARAILARNMAFAASVIEAASEGLCEERIPVVLTGGLTAEEETLRLLRASLKNPSRYELFVLSVPPVRGSLILARELFERAQAEKKGGLPQ